MDPVRNPYAPGAGTPPPELAGRDQLRENVRIAIARIRLGNAAKSVIMVGLRGVGKTVLLEQMRTDAEATGAQTIRMEAPEGRSLPALLAPQLRLALLRLSRTEAARHLAERGLRALAGFAKSLKVRFHDLEVGLDLAAEAGLADNGDLQGDLTALLEQVGLAARAAGTTLILFLDELQYVKQSEFASLIAALHRCAQDRLPIALVGAGLPQLPQLAGSAKSYAERLFTFPFIGPLPDPAARDALLKPARQHQVDFTDSALAVILEKTRGYPYFLQEWGKQAWDTAAHSPIDLPDILRATDASVAALDESFFRVRFDRLTPAEKRYLRAMAELGPGPHRSGDIAMTLGKGSNALGPLKKGLIRKGMLWSPAHGDTAFTVPLFDEFMKRIMPGEQWRTEL